MFLADYLGGKIQVFFSTSGNNALNNIALQLCHEKVLLEKSSFSNFLGVLPDDVSYIPALWPDDKVCNNNCFNHLVVSQFCRP